MPRATVNEETKAAILTASGRRCCICAALHYDHSVKQGQIAHLNHDSSNPSLDNLVWLCLNHHDMYDSTTSQSHGLTVREVRGYRDRLYKRISSDRRSKQHEIDFLQAYLTIIGPDISPSDRYADILSRHLDSLKKEIERLSAAGNWDAVLDIRARLREYFEYSGRYREGYAFGSAYANALRELGDTFESLWVRVKDMGYMLILDGQHARGRMEIEGVLKELASVSRADRATAWTTLEFYAHRYLGISHHRDPSADLPKARRCLDRAQSVIQQLDHDTTDYRALLARLRGNYANLALDSREEQKALHLYEQSLVVFQELGDLEHSGITHLNIAKAVIKLDASTKTDALTHLSKAQAAFSQLGWLEGLGRIHEQRAYYYLALAHATTDDPVRPEHASAALREAQTAMGFFRSMNSDRLSGRVEVLMDEIRRLALTTRRGRHRTNRYKHI